MHTRNSEFPLCRHTKTDGRLCQAPALLESAFCRHHQKLHRTRPRTISSGPGLSTSVLHPLRHARDMQQALSMVLSGIASNRIHPKTGYLMLSAIQTAIKAQRRY